MCALPPPRARRRAACTRHTKNCCALLTARSVGTASSDLGLLLGVNLKILRNFILQDGTEFVKVWSKTSKSLISYESGRIFFDNYRCCYSSLLPRPVRLYELPKAPRAQKIEDALLCQSVPGVVLPDPADQRACLLTLSGSNCLTRLSADTGHALQQVYLSACWRFRSLAWDTPQETFSVQSVQHRQTRLEHQAGVDRSIFMCLAVFQVFPLQLVGMLEIDKKVFGQTVTDVSLSQGVLVVSHSSRCVKLYSFDYIVQKFRGEELSLGQSLHYNGVPGIVGEAPLGIPLNIHVRECPPVLFQMCYLEGGVQIGAHPWHYIYTPNQKRHRGTHHICSVAGGALARGGVQDMACDSLEADSIFFHPDDSGRIVHLGPSLINVLRIVPVSGDDDKYQVVTEFSISAARDSGAPPPQVTSSGRTVKRRLQLLDDDPSRETFQTLRYEDELELLVVLDVSQAGEEGRARLRLHHNTSGRLLRAVPLEESWDVTFSHEVWLDRDVIVHSVRERNNTFSCHVYKIQRGSPAP